MISATTLLGKAKWSGIRDGRQERILQCIYQACYGKYLVVVDEGVVVQDTGRQERFHCTQNNKESYGTGDKAKFEGLQW